jgi:hypothetical protein
MLCNVAFFSVKYVAYTDNEAVLGITTTGSRIKGGRL